MAGAAGCAALLAATWFGAFHVAVFGRADQSAYMGFIDLQNHGVVQSLSNFLVSLCDPSPYLYVAPLVVVIALLRGRPWVALAAAAILLGANVTTQLLKELTAAPRPDSLFGGWEQLPPSSWPSGHTTAAMSLVLASILAVPARLRPAVAALGAAFAVGVGYSLLATGRHYPSDVLGGLLVAAAWALLAVAALLWVERRRPALSLASGRVSLRAALGPPGAVLAAAVVVVGIVALSRPHDVLAYARAHEYLVALAGAIGALGLTLPTGVMLTIRR